MEIRRQGNLGRLNKGTMLYCGDSGEKMYSSQKLAEFYEQLKEFGFAYAHNSYIVNLKHVLLGW